MTAYPQGKIAPATAGTPVQLSAPAAGTSSNGLVACILVAQIGGTTGATYFGRVGLNRTTLAGVIFPFLAPGASGFINVQEIGDQDGPNVVNPLDYAVDAANNNEGMLITYIVA